MAGEGSTIPAESVVCEASSSSTLTTTIPNRRGKREFTGTRQVPRFNRNLQQHERSATALDRPGRGAGQIRPRSLFTARTDDYHGHVDSPFVPRAPAYSRSSSKFFNGDVTAADWNNIQSNAVSAASATVVSGTTVYSPNGIYGSGSGESADNHQHHGVMNTNPKAQAMFAAMQNIQESGGPNNPQLAWNFRGETVDETCLGALVTHDGFITVRLNHGIRVDMTSDRAIRIQNNPYGIIMALNASGSSAAVIHPSGRVYQYGSRVEITTADQRGNCKYAKMWHKGVSFSSEACALVYLVDTAGTRTTTESFSDMSGDFSVPVFLGESNYGATTLQECMAHLQNLNYWVSEDGIENWIINGVRISQTPDGMVRVGRTSSKHNMRTSPFNGTASMSTPYVHCTASIGTACHLFVKRGERRMHYDGLSFIVRNAGHSAGFDDDHKLKVY